MFKRLYDILSRNMLFPLGLILIPLGQVIGEDGYFLRPLYEDRDIKFISLGFASLLMFSISFLLFYKNKVDRSFVFAISRNRIVLIFVVISLFSLFGLWRGLFLEGLKLWIFSSGIGLFVSSFGVATMATSLLKKKLTPSKWLAFILNNGLIFIAISALVYFISGIIFSGFLYDGIPHFGDAVIYATQANIYLDGGLTSKSPGADLLAWSPPLRYGEEGLYGKYPPGWPLVLSLFTQFNLGWLANVVMLLLNVTLSFAIARRLFSKQIAILAAIIMLLSGWSVIASTEWLSHLAVSFWLMLFFYSYDTIFFESNKGEDKNRFSWRNSIFSLIAGVSLFMAVLTRQLDSVVYLAPIVVYSIYILYSRFFLSIIYLFPMGIAGVGAITTLLYMNQYLRGKSLETTYGGSYADQLSVMASNSAKGLIEHVIWFQQSISEINLMWFSGVAVFIPYVFFGFLSREVRSHRTRLFLISNLGIVIAYGIVSFQGLAWFGPRWYIPLIPILSILAAAGLCYLGSGANHIEGSKSSNWSNTISEFFVAFFLIATVTGMIIGLPFWGTRLANSNPASVGGDLFYAVKENKLKNSVVALYPVNSGISSGKLIRNGVWKNTYPLESNNVIYILRSKDWEERACHVWPQRHIYTLSKNDTFDFIEINCVQDTVER